MAEGLKLVIAIFDRAQEQNIVAGTHAYLGICVTLAVLSDVRNRDLLERWVIHCGEETWTQ